MGLGIVEAAAAPKEGEHRVGVGPVYLHLLQNWELDIVVVLHEGSDLLRGAAFLGTELVAGESHNF